MEDTLWAASGGQVFIISAETHMVEVSAEAPGGGIRRLPRCHVSWCPAQPLTRGDPGSRFPGAYANSSLLDCASKADYLGHPANPFLTTDP